ncbi:ppGpp synthetase/RelA/SpoT-type nucleotidyltransferase [Pseudoclavibacter sp. JAI123]|uniref:RelA/SpoT domain-containing protein n=1 Tax=Pseudoclavibacter sp. JAI123 TaxID=2723065 RepID=UPI0015CB2281|nr:RelA/SpoT domain-containing protein [Pseudoclavibacter sp. JAI123]NYF14054.1 ppGpp synthetase/RelA/SpoT-type nucleotidyltransferase [Pseudoclavibacter sp. JAI123]
MAVIDDFLEDYERQFDFWDASARIARGLLESALASSGLRAIVTSRAKSVDRLSVKLHARNRDMAYRSVAQIKKDIVDLAGVRVALYFPGQMDEAEQVIRTTLDVQHDKRFPPDRASTGPKVGTPDPLILLGEQAASPGETAHVHRFSGYGARHFRVLIPDSRLTTGQDRYASALVEVQMASVLMHAWSEVEHDLVYKPLGGELSSSEYALLDQLNGLVLAGEIALEQLQKAGDARVSMADTPFRDHYELAEFLRSRLSDRGVNVTDSTLGQVDALFDYLSTEESATASIVESYLDSLERDFEHRPVADQLADLMLSGDESRYKAYLRAMETSRHPSNLRRTTTASLRANAPRTLALGEFVTAWVLLETLLKDILEVDKARLPPLPVLFRQLAARELITSEEDAELRIMRDLRNRVIHGGAADVTPESLRESAAWLRHLTRTIELKVDGR